MNEEKKEYSIIGQVTIGTDEYRDLIETPIKIKAEYESKIAELTYQHENKVKDMDTENHSLSERNSNLYWEKVKLQNEVNELRKYKEFVTEKAMDSYKLWKIEKEEVKE